MIKLPAVSNPHRYAGLYVYDFGTHAAIGYTAGEVRVLRASQAHSDGTAYEIYRVTEAGGFELRGVSDDKLSGHEAMAFLRATPAAARADYEELISLAESARLPMSATAQLYKDTAYRPAHVCALMYPAPSATALSNWLSTSGYAGGDDVVCGQDIHMALTALPASHLLDARPLPTLFDHTDRCERELLQTVDVAVQR